MREEKYRVKYLEGLEDAQVASLMIESIDMQKKFNLEPSKVDERLADKLRIDVEQLEGHFRVDKVSRTYKYPILKEAPGVTFYGRKTVPGKGFAWHIHAEEYPNGFGVHDVLFKLDKVFRNENDPRFSKIDTAHTLKHSYFYNYTNDTYELVEDFKNKQDEKTMEYLERQEAYYYAYSRLGGYYRDYLRKVVEIGEYAASMRTNVHKSDDVFKFIDTFEEFFKFATGALTSKVLFSHFHDNDEYQVISEYIEELQLGLRGYRDKLSELLEHDGIQSVHFTGPENSSPWMMLYMDFYKSFQSAYQGKYIPFVAAYEQKDKEITSEKGFFKVTKDKAYPTLYELEKRRHYTVVNEKKEYYEEEIAKIIKRNSPSS